MKYIDVDKLKKLINEKWQELADKNVKAGGGKWDAEISTYLSVLGLIDSLQQEQQKDKQVVVITESHGNANIEWDCRSLDDVMALLKSAESFISDKQVEKLRGLGYGPDYDTVEGRYSKLLRYQQEQPEGGCSGKPNDLLSEQEPTCKTCDYYENDCPFTRGKFIVYPNKVCKDYTQSHFANVGKMEQPEVDLEKEFQEYWYLHQCDHRLRRQVMDGHGKAVLRNVAGHFYELGLIARKEE